MLILEPEESPALLLGRSPNYRLLLLLQTSQRKPKQLLEFWFTDSELPTLEKSPPSFRSSDIQTCSALVDQHPAFPFNRMSLVPSCGSDGSLTWKPMGFLLHLQADVC
ncbi:hypothetical protein ILYODFUR_007052 [Ilyodon furcidens]|uniref:Uncharacterized protein n=1 Tax=Ilyodon furcidens TaxID=33524 RepID=A0ABV0VEL1_9TELE